ncbi:hypothetical protein FRB94_000531 [Tulasnella sp. JGI-2019a]|nr:hypothetical protein FRB94_000531 [Tulasnella sp. JGI-2019a]
MLTAAPGARVLSTEGETQTVPEDEKPITPMWLLYNPNEQNPNPTIYDDINYIPHTTLKNPRSIRFPDQWPTGPNSNTNDKDTQAAVSKSPTDVETADAVPLSAEQHRQVYYTVPDKSHLLNRLDKQHAVLTRTIEGLYIPKELVRDRLASDPTDAGTVRKKRVLDLGTSGANWAIDMALEFPDVDVIAIDVVGTKPRQNLPPNCHLVYHSFVEPLPQYHDQFDIVHIRSIASETQDYYHVLKEASRCLKAGGLMLLSDGDLQLLKYDLSPQDICLDDDKYNAPPQYSWLSRVFFEVYTFLKERGTEVDAGLLIEERLRRCPVFENIETRKIYTPVGTWSTSDDPEEQAKLDFCGELMMQNMKQFIRALQPLCMTCGISPKQFQQWMDDVDWELDGQYIKSNIRWHYAWAIKKVDAYPGEEEELGPEPEPMSDPEPEVDYDEWGNEIPLRKDDDVAEEDNAVFYSDEYDEEEQGSGSFVQSWDGGDDEDAESAWSRSPSRSPELRSVGLDGQFTAYEWDQRRSDSEDEEEEGDCYEEEYGSTRSDGSGPSAPPAARTPEQLLANPHPFLADPLVAALVGSTVTVGTTTAVDEEGGVPSPPAVDMAYPAHLMPAYKAKLKEDTAEDLPYAFLDYGATARRPIPTRSIMNPNNPTPDITVDLAHFNAMAKNFQIRKPNPNPEPPSPPQADANLILDSHSVPPPPQRLDAAKLAKTLPYPNPLSFAPNPAVGWAPDPEAVAAAELRARLQDMRINGEEEKVLAKAEEVEDELRGYRRPIVPTAPPNGRGLHDGKAARRRAPGAPVPEVDGMPARGRRERYA